MNSETSDREIKWYDKRLLVGSIATGLILFATLWEVARRAEPPPGQAFQKLPTLSGVYSESKGRYGTSWIGSTVIHCWGTSYYGGGARGNCGMGFNDVQLHVERTLVPTYDGLRPIVSRIESNGFIIRENSPQRMIEIWKSNSRFEAFLLAFNFTAILHAAQLIFLNRRFKHKKPETEGSLN